MKKILAISLIAFTAVSTANAQIASQAYVDTKDALKADKTYVGTIPTEGVGANSANVIAYVDAKVANANSGTTGAIEALDATVSQTAGTDGLALSVTQADGVITAVSGSIAAETYDEFGAAATAKSEAISAAAADATTKANAAESRANTYTDGKVGTLGTHEVGGQQVAYTDVVDFVNDKITTVTGDASALAGRVETAEDDIDALQEKVGDTAVSSQITTAIAGLDSNGAAAANKVITGVTMVDGKITSVTSEDPLTQAGYLLQAENVGAGKYALTAIVNEGGTVTGYAWELISR